MSTIFLDFLGSSLEAFIDNVDEFFGNYFDDYISHLKKFLEVFIRKSLTLSFKKSHFKV